MPRFPIFLEQREHRAGNRPHTQSSRTSIFISNCSDPILLHSLAALSERLARKKIPLGDNRLDRKRRHQPPQIRSPSHRKIHEEGGSDGPGQNRQDGRERRKGQSERGPTFKKVNVVGALVLALTADLAN